MQIIIIVNGNGKDMIMMNKSNGHKKKEKI